MNPEPSPPKQCRNLEELHIEARNLSGDAIVHAVCEAALPRLTSLTGSSLITTAPPTMITTGSQAYSYCSVVGGRWGLPRLTSLTGCPPLPNMAHIRQSGLGSSKLGTYKPVWIRSRATSAHIRQSIASSGPIVQALCEAALPCLSPPVPLPSKHI